MKTKVRINGELQAFNYSVRKDGLLFYRKPKGVKGYNEKGKPVYDYDYVYAKSELELKEKIKALFENEVEQKSQKQIFATDIQRWLKLTMFKHIKGTTYDRYEQVIKYQIVPAAEKLQNKLVKQITMDDIKVILNSITDSGKSESTLKKARHLLKSYFHDKLIAGEIERDPTDFKPRTDIAEEYKDTNNSKKVVVTNDEGEVAYLKDDEIERIKNVCNNGYTLVGKTPSIVRRDDKIYNCKPSHDKITNCKVSQSLFFIFMLNTGIRAGEAVAMKYSDIDFKTHQMTVRANTRYIKNRDKEGNLTGGRCKIEGSPKTKGSKATVIINDTAINILKEMLKDEPEGYSGYILHETRKGYDKNPLSPHALYKRWQTVCKYADVEPKGLHCLRHTCASKMFASTNGNVKAVSTLLRHCDEAFTMKIYIDLIKKYQEKIAETFEV